MVCGDDKGRPRHVVQNDPRVGVRPTGNHHTTNLSFGYCWDVKRVGTGWTFTIPFLLTQCQDEQELCRADLLSGQPTSHVKLRDQVSILGGGVMSPTWGLPLPRLENT